MHLAPLPTHELLPVELSRQRVAGLLRHGFGSDYLGNWGRCAPCTQRWQHVSVFALLPDGAYRYDAAAHRMLLITMDDLRHLARGVDANPGPAIELVYVVDCDGMQRARDEEHGVLPGSDPGGVAERVEARSQEHRVRAAVHGVKDRRGLAQALALGPDHVIAFAQVLAMATPATPLARLQEQRPAARSLAR